MADMLPPVIASLTANVEDFIRDWNNAAEAAERAAARIRAAQEAAGNGPGGGGNGAGGGGGDNRITDRDTAEIEAYAEAARRAAAAVDDLGDSSHNAGDGADDLGDSSDNAGDSVAQLGNKASKAGGMLQGVQAGAMVLAASILPAVAAAALAGGAALEGMGVAAGVAAMGGKGLSQVFDTLGRNTASLRRQLDSVFRTGLNTEMSKLGQSVSSLAPQFKEVAQAEVGLVKGITEWVRSSEGINQIKTLLGGVRDLVNGLAPGAADLVKAFVGFGAAAAPSMGKIGQALGSIFTQLKQVIDEAAKSGDLGKAFDAGAKAIHAFGTILAGVVDILIQMAAQGGPEAADALEKFGQILKDNAPAIGAFFKALAQVADSLATGASAISKFLDALGPMKDVVSQASGALSAGLATGNWKPALDMLAPAVGAAYQKVSEVTKSQLGKLGSTAQSAWTNVKSAFSQGGQAVVQSTTQANQKIGAAFQQGNQKLGQIASDVWSKIKQSFSQGNQQIVQISSQMWQRVQQAFQQGNQKLAQIASDLWSKVKQGFSQANQALAQAAQQIWEKVSQAFSDGVDNVIQFVSDLGRKIIDTLKDLPQKAMQIGSDIIDGLAQGIQSAVGKLVSAATQVAQQALNAIKSTLGISSPSKVFADEVGHEIPAGIAMGITGNQGVIASAMSRLPGLAPSRGVAMGRYGGSAAAMSSGPQVITLQVGSGGDSAVGVMLSRLAQQGKLKITANAIVGGRP